MIVYKRKEVVAGSSEVKEYICVKLLGKETTSIYDINVLTSYLANRDIQVIAKQLGKSVEYVEQQVKLAKECDILVVD